MGRRGRAGGRDSPPGNENEDGHGQDDPDLEAPGGHPGASSYDIDGEKYPATAYVFGNEVGQRINDVKTAWLATCKRAKITDLRLHDLRREAGSRWLDGGVALHTVRDWLGHTSVAQTSTYLPTTAKTSHDAMRRFEAVRAESGRTSKNDHRGSGQAVPPAGYGASQSTPDSRTEHGPH